LENCRIPDRWELLLIYTRFFVEIAKSLTMYLFPRKTWVRVFVVCHLRELKFFKSR
jgi:hypothetical protein